MCKDAVKRLRKYEKRKRLHENIFLQTLALFYVIMIVKFEYIFLYNFFI